MITVDGKRFLQPGDSYLLEDHLFVEDIDVLFFSPTEHNTCIDRCVILLNTLDPSYIFLNITVQWSLLNLRAFGPRDIPMKSGFVRPRP